MDRIPDDRDATWYYGADVYDERNTRYPIRVMIESEAVYSLPEKDRPDTAIVEELYRYEILELLKAGKLRPAGNMEVNRVFLTDRTGDIKDDDIVIWDVADKVAAARRRLG